MADVGEVLMSVLSTIRVPKPGDRVHKDECALSFASPESEGGLYLCMNSFLGFGSQYVDRHSARSGQRAYLHITRTRKSKKEDDANSASGHPPKKKPTRLAIGIEGGFDVEQEQYDEDIKVVILPDRQEVTSEDLNNMPDVVKERVSLSMAGIMAADSVSHTLQVQQWDGEVRQESRHAAELKQLDNGLKIPPSGWRCDVCDLQENLWMNLTDGKVLCGRRYFDGTGGNNHALLHFQETGYPLAVKLGTITPDGADVFSYDEDDMVLDSKLPEHLSHFGIDMMTMEKTERTMTELEIAVNQHVGEWEVIQESGTTLRPLYGPGLTGIKNLGNSCYLNSVMQVLFTVPDFQTKYVSNIDKIIDEAPSDPTQDFKTQVAKLGYGLLSGEYSKPAPDPGEENESSEPRGDQVGIAPRMFKALVGRGHPEFSTNRQQDAQEFLLHFINMVERNSRSGPNPSEAFRFLVEERIVCQQSQKAKYTQRVDYIIQLPVPMDQAVNTEELQEAECQREEGGDFSPLTVRAQIPFTACMAALSEPEVLTDFWSSAVQAKTTATKTTRFASFPDHLVIQIKKFTFGLDWVPKKLDVSIDVPDTLDLSALRATGQQPGEELLPEVAPPPLVTPDVEVKGILGFHGNEEDDSLYSPLLSPVLDDATVSQLCEMGFPMEACRKAVYYTGNTGSDSAMNWIMSHIDDPDFSAPLVMPGCSSGPGTTPTESISEEHLATIVSMGFSRDQATKALRATSNVLDRAVDWIFSHLDDLESMDVSEGGRSAAESEGREPPPGPHVRDGAGKYELIAFISHMGTSTMCGHYVCHIKKDQQWVIFNDQKVCASEKPPKDLGYLYFYRRVAQ
ncbi:ubiquitin carboxyl-terminal hydrolase 5 isoform X1 [Cynoglossus semilaevis]|uniref:ubiquitin carboxyl-terminal hydrolase 5 isoform X1 n=1 Tax=Cynoglossus semilaevis TaxID=244447 RepID=UPI0004968368|nr:ubiquitin carboxyl-terminal hydrolase 5 isoform X1 [Cynoglossus semilaevis]XP_016893330.1 ubiquitin carboxyl-terminal hydrolase 5 isoform X1 [Cynoglossus semilaevis]